MKGDDPIISFEEVDAPPPSAPSNYHFRPPNIGPNAVADRTHTRGRKLSAKTKLGRFIRDRGYTGETVARNTGISSRILSGLVTGKRYPTPDHTVALCKFLKCNPWDILE